MPELKPMQLAFYSIVLSIQAMSNEQKVKQLVQIQIPTEQMAVRLIECG